jgi:multidrug efflux pump
MHLSAPFIQRPVATTLLSLALLLAGSVAYSLLPVASLPNVDYPVIGASAGLPGASPETMASAVATPLERQFGRIAGVNQMTSSSSLGSASVTLQFDINRNIDAAARDVQAAINAARSQLPSYLPQNPSYRKANPAEAPILILTLTSDVVTKPQIYDLADSILAQKLSQIQGVGQVFVGGSAQPAVRAELNPTLLGSNGVGLEAVRTALSAANANRPKGAFQDATKLTITTKSTRPAITHPLLSATTKRLAPQFASPTWEPWSIAFPTSRPPASRGSTRIKVLRHS